MKMPCLNWLGFEYSSLRYGSVMRRSPSWGWGWGGGGGGGGVLPLRLSGFGNMIDCLFPPHLIVIPQILCRDTF